MKRAANETGSLNYKRLPKQLQEQLRPAFDGGPAAQKPHLAANEIYQGDALDLLPQIEPNSVALSVWSPPCFVGKSYECHLKFEEWQSLLKAAVALHWPIVRPGGFLVINIADILCFRDSSMPKVQAHNVARHRSSVTREDVLRAMAENPTMSRYQIAALLRCTEQTVDRRLNGNNIRGGKYDTQTRLKIVGGLIEEWGIQAGFYPYDRRIWVKDAAWENSRWSILSYRAVDEFEYLYFLWKPGVTVVDRKRLSPDEWTTWGSRAVWFFPSVRANDDHEAKFPVELPRRVIQLLTDPGDLVLDCFLGSGTTAIAAKLSGRRYIGIELLEEYVRLAKAGVAEILPFACDVHQAQQLGAQA
jgi:site-specific DNA-methyltransferase (adenine-specific)